MSDTLIAEFKVYFAAEFTGLRPVIVNKLIVNFRLGCKIIKKNFMLSEHLVEALQIGFNVFKYLLILNGNYTHIGLNNIFYHIQVIPKRILRIFMA